MGHQVLECFFCGSYVMEGHSDWECKCGAICNAQTRYIWEKEKTLRTTRCSCSDPPYKPDIFEKRSDPPYKPDIFEKLTS